MRLGISKALAFLKPKRRWFQYSLRTLLILTAAFAVWLGLWTHSARKQQRAVEAIREIGGQVVYEPVYVNWSPGTSNAVRLRQKALSKLSWLHDLVGIDFLHHVWAVRLYDAATDADLAHLEAIPHLESLIVGGDDVTDAGLVHLRKQRHLKELMLGSKNVTDTGLLHLQPLRELRYLALIGSVIDEGLQQLAPLEKLETLFIMGPTGASRTALRARNELDQLTVLEYVEVPLKEVVDYLSEYHGTKLQIDEEALAGAHVDMDVAVTITAKNVPLRDGLDSMLGPLGLGWMITPDGIVITTREVVALKHAGINRLKQALPSLKAYIVVE